MFYKLLPACPGLIGADSVGDLTIPQIEKLHFVFLSDYLEPIVCEQNQFLATEEVQQAVMSLVPAPGSVLFTRENQIVTTDGYQFDALWPDLVPEVSKYLWMKVSGEAGKDDFGFQQSQLIISERIYESIKHLNFEFGVFEEWSA
jgi:hypothetical protein